MKKRTSALLAALSFCLLLTACGHDMKNVSGEVVDILEDTASDRPILIIQEGKRQKAVLLTEHTYVYPGKPRPPRMSPWTHTAFTAKPP